MNTPGKNPFRLQSTIVETLGVGASIATRNSIATNKSLCYDYSNNNIYSSYQPVMNNTRASLKAASASLLESSKKPSSRLASQGPMQVPSNSIPLK